MPVGPAEGSPALTRKALVRTQDWQPSPATRGTPRVCVKASPCSLKTWSCDAPFGAPTPEVCVEKAPRGVAHPTAAQGDCEDAWRSGTRLLTGPRWVRFPPSQQCIRRGCWKTAGLRTRRAWFDSTDGYLSPWLRRSTARTADCRSVNTGSIPVGVASLALSSNGTGSRIFTPRTRVQLPSGLLLAPSSNG